MSQPSSHAESVAPEAAARPETVAEPGATEAAPTHHQFLIVGGGTAGICMAARLTRALSDADVAVIDPARHHDYQPLWTLVGGGVYPKERSRRRMADLIPPRAHWYPRAVERFDPERSRVALSDGRAISYDYLIVAPGLQVQWDRIPGLAESIGTNGVCSNYAYQHADYTWQCLRETNGGTLLFTHPGDPIKCGGAPQKIMYMAADLLRRRGRLDAASIQFHQPAGQMFPVDAYNEALQPVVERYGIETHFGSQLAEVRGSQREAVFRVTDGDGHEEHRTVSFDVLHVTPPQGPPPVVAESPLADAAGWVDVDPATLRHRRYANVFALGDAANLPTSKTAAAIRKQAPVAAANLLEVVRGRSPQREYDGYTACPIVTGYGKLILAEFDYSKTPTPSVPLNTERERASMYQLKKRGLPALYWRLMLKGRG